MLYCECTVEDPDGDIVKCRWALSELGECGDVCNAFPNATLDEVSRKIILADLDLSGCIYGGIYR